MLQRIRATGRGLVLGCVLAGACRGAAMGAAADAPGDITACETARAPRDAFELQIPFEVVACLQLARER